MPSRLTLVPGSQGPKHSGSVARATSDVFTATERVRTIICSHGEAISLLPTAARRWRGGGAGVETGDSICEERSEGGERKKGTHETLQNHCINTHRADVRIQLTDATMTGSTERLVDIVVFHRPLKVIFIRESDAAAVGAEMYYCVFPQPSR